MKVYWMLRCIVIFLILGQAIAPAQTAPPDPSSGLLMERVRVQPEGGDTVPATTVEPPVFLLPVIGYEALVYSRHLWADFDGDGFTDLFVLSPKGNLIFRNRGDGDFEDMTPLVFPDGAGCGKEGLAGDYNRDDLPDIWLFLEKGFTLYRNEGGMHFSDVTTEVGLDLGTLAGQARLEDYDLDGFEDLLVMTPDADRVFHNQEGFGFVEKIIGEWTANTIPGSSDQTVSVIKRGPSSSNSSVDESTALGFDSQTESAATLASSGVNNGGYGTPGSVSDIKNRSGSGSAASMPSTSDWTGSMLPGPEPAAMLTANAMFVNDNSPGSVGEGIPEVEGGDDGTTDNDIVDGTVTGADVAEESLSASKVIGTAATLTGNQNFDAGTFYVDATNNRVGVGTTNPSSSSLHVKGASTYGCRVENTNASGTGVYGTSPDTGVYGYSSDTTGFNHGVYSVSDSIEGNGVFGETTSATGQPCGVRRGFADIETIRENHAWVPEVRGEPYGTQFPEAIQEILVKNGTLNPDLTPNENTAAKMGWILSDPEVEEEKADLSLLQTQMKAHLDLRLEHRELDRSAEADLDRSAAMEDKNDLEHEGSSK